MPVKSLASLVTAVVVAEVAGSAEVLALSAALSADTLSDTLSDVLADTLSDVLTDTLADALDASKTCEEAATLDASVELQAVKLSAALTIAAAMVNFFFIVISPFCFHVLPAVVQAIFFRGARFSPLSLTFSLVLLQDPLCRMCRVLLSPLWRAAALPPYHPYLSHKKRAAPCMAPRAAVRQRLISREFFSFPFFPRPPYISV